MKWEKGKKEKMKISDIEYRTFKEVEAMKRFDLKSMPKKSQVVSSSSSLGFKHTGNIHSWCEN